MRQSETTTPRHVGLILDGNRRWAKENGLPKLKGHQAGYENLKDIVKHGFDQGVEFISAYIFSTENWNRTKQEVTYLMDLALNLAVNEVDELHKENIKVRFLGSQDKLSQKLIKAIASAEAKTSKNTRGTVALCFNYGGQQEIVDAAEHAINSGENLSIQSIENHLYASDVPPVDLVIRTSGEQRLSNFMLWRIAYAELYFAKKHWPAFTTEDFDTALDEYASRQRRFGS